MAEQKKILLVDFDDTICQSVFLKKVNDFLGTDYKIKQFKEYLIDSIVPEDRRKEFFDSFFESDPYEKLPLIDGAKDALKKLSEKYDIYVCSSCVMLNSPKSSARLFSSKYEYLIKKLPFLDPKKFIFTSSKTWGITLNSGDTAGVLQRDSGWKQIVTNDFNGKTVKTVTIDLSASDLQITSGSVSSVSLSNYINASTRVIRVEGYYVPPENSGYYETPVYLTNSTMGLGGVVKNSSGFSFVVAGSTSGKKGSGYAKFYYVE